MADQRKTIEIDHPAWSEPVSIDLEDKDVFEVVINENGQFDIVKPDRSLGETGVARSGIKSVNEHADLCGVVSRLTGFRFSVGENIVLDTVDQCVDNGVFLITRQSSDLRHDLPHCRHENKDEVPAVEFVGHFKPSFFIADRTVTYCGGVLQ